MAMLGMALAAVPAQAQTIRHVWQASPSPDGNYISWPTAARNIQDAIDAADPGDLIWVTNGVYDTGGVAGYPEGTILTNRVAIHKPVIVQSVNGSSSTFIAGRRHNPGGDQQYTNYCGEAAVRCVYITNFAVLSGFTLTNGATAYASVDNDHWGGGAFCESTNAAITNCVFIRNVARTGGGGVRRGTLYDCSLVSNGVDRANQSRAGGGAIGGILYNCELIGNTAASGGGVGNTTWLYNCRLHGNYANHYGGGAFMSYLYNCVLTGNNSPSGGGAYGRWAGTVYQMYNCVFAGNTATRGGGVFDGQLYNCIATGNSAGTAGGGIYLSTNFCTSWNSIAYNNKGPDVSSNFFATHSTFFFSCSSPLPPGPDNIDANPRFKDPGSGYGLSHVLGDYRLTAGSPCVNIGTNFSWQTLDPLNRGRDRDLDGRPRITMDQVDMGAYERVPKGAVIMFRGR